METPRFYLPPIVSTPLKINRSATREETIPELPGIAVKGAEMDNPAQTLQRPNQLCIDEYFTPHPLGKPDQRLEDESVNRFSLGGKRHVVVKVYRGIPFVNIREYFTKNGAKDRFLPGKRGINLRGWQWAKLDEKKHFNS
ncbi:hypothetical protein HOLleu_01269 [Holothuria leucospilota]|uniref:Transcriptional coactivator p15 (PC4) C-terminal domain-containing protein n=1 Tax=Holothuria leucospilota TaxID=206669 RepID=A0A9Q1CQ33_HOLLE|nr:hypothetical protein HOLleu_01269 [Holothuria leucospilota]